MIDGSKEWKRQITFELQNSSVFEKCTKLPQTGRRQQISCLQAQQSSETVSCRQTILASTLSRKQI